MGRERRRQLLLLALSTLASLTFAEAALRLSGIVASDRGSPWFAGGNHPRFLFQPDAQAGYTLRPGFHGREVAATREFAVSVTVDAGGLRDHRHVGPAHPAVLAIGDSMTFGEGVAEAQAWPAALEGVLGTRVYDGGVPGYGSPQMRAHLQQLLPRLRPDVVVVLLGPRWDAQRCREPFRYMDGFIVSAAYRDKLRLIDGNLWVADVRWPLVGTATAWAKRWSHLARLALPAVRAAAGAVADRAVRSPPQPAGSERLRATATALAGMRQDAAAAGARLLVVFIDSRGRPFELDRALLADLLRRDGISFVALDDLIPQRTWPSLRFPRDTHWNERGHRVVGERLAPFVRSLLGHAASGQR